MKIAFRNFLHMLRRYKVSSLLTVVGLTLAFSAFYIILVQVWWETGYNRSLPDAERTYLVLTEDWSEPGKWDAWLNRPVAERVIASAPGIEAGGCMWGGFGNGSVWIERAEGTPPVRLGLSSGSFSPGFLDAMSFRAAEGDLAAFDRPGTVLLSRSAARRLGVGVGDRIWIDVEEPKPADAVEVAALFEDFPRNSALGGLEAVKNVGELYLDDPTNWSFNYVVRLHPGTDPRGIEKQWDETAHEMTRSRIEQALAAGEEPDDDPDDIDAVRLMPFEELYFADDADTPFARGSLATTLTLLAIAVVVICLAFINFVNFFFALIPVRIRTVNTFKVFGAPVASLRFNFVFEAFGLVFLALLAAWYVAYAAGGSELASYISAPLALRENLAVVATVAAVAFGMALAASLYPAWYITSFSVAQAAKGSFAGSASGRRLRTTLLGVQFAICSGLIVAAAFIRLQHAYMLSYDMGFDKQGLLAVNLPTKAAQKFGTLQAQLVADPLVADVTGATGSLVAVGRMGWGRDFRGEQIYFDSYPVHWNFLHMLGIPIVDGRDFLESDMHRDKGVLIFNESAARSFGIGAGDRLNGFVADEEVVGICADFNFRPLQYKVAPFAFYILPRMTEERGWQLFHTLYVRMRPGADMTAAADRIRQAVRTVDPTAEEGEIRIRDFDEELGREYDTERRLLRIVGLFTLLAVGIALMGVFGLVLFETQHRRREIAVRKVMGATTREILAMFNRRYVRLVVVSFALSLPPALWAVDRWLETFAYPTPLRWWVFAGALAAILAVTVATVTLRSWRAAAENPADSIKSE